MSKPTGRPRGRPPLVEGEKTVQLHLSLPESTFDRLCSLAQKRDESLPSVVRRAVALAIGRRDPREP